MTFARLIDGAITAPYAVPQILDETIDLRPMDPALLATHGIYEIVETTRLADTAATTSTRTVELVAGKPTYVWTVRPKTADELAADLAQTNNTTIRTQAEAALIGLRTTATSTGTLTGAQLSNAVRLMAKVLIALVRLQLSKLDSTD